MKELIKSVSGIRGIWGEALSLDAVIKYVSAFGTFVNHGKVVLGRDTRTTGEMFSHASIAALISVGCDIIDVGQCPTPTCQLMVRKSNAAGGIVITASHNPVEWNGLKFINHEGSFLNEFEFGQFLDIFDHNRIRYSKLSESKSIQQDGQFNQQAISSHIEKICNYIDVNLIKQKRYKVVVDACNGVGSRLIIPLLKNLGCQSIELNCLENGLFPRGAEPTAENVTELCRLVMEKKADIGFAVDPDGDRLSIVTETGEALGEEMTLPLVAQHVLRKKGGVVVTNLSTSMAVDFVARQHQTQVIRTKIGEANVVTAIKSNPCYVGGEGNGGVIVPEINCARDTGAGIGIILDYMATSGMTISGLAALLPKYSMIKKKVDIPQEQIKKIIDHFRLKYQNERIDTTDGIKVMWDDAWIHIRRSGTEGLVRVMTEALTMEKADKMAKDGINEILLAVKIPHAN